MSDKSIPDKLRVPNEDHVPWLLRRIWDRVNEENEHFMGVIVGREGSGKSHTAIRIASELDPTFDAEERVIFKISKLLKVLESGDHDEGDFYVLDEAGVQFGIRTWQERGQVLANQALQLIRNHNLGLIFTLPRLSELDTQAQGRLQAILTIEEKQDGEFVRGPWAWFDPDRRDYDGNVYQKLPRRIQDGQKIRVDTVAFAPPDPELIEPYEKRKREFQKQFYQKTIEKLEGEEEQEEDEEKSVQDIAKEIKDDGIQSVVSEHGTTGEPYINPQLIRAMYDTTHDDSKAIKHLLEKEIDLSKVEA